MAKMTARTLDAVAIVTQERDDALSRLDWRTKEVTALTRDIAALRAEIATLRARVADVGHHLTDAHIQAIAIAAGKAAVDAAIREAKRLRHTPDAAAEEARIAKMVPNDKPRCIEIDDVAPVEADSAAKAILALRVKKES